MPEGRFKVTGIRNSYGETTCSFVITEIHDHKNSHGWAKKESFLHPNFKTVKQKSLQCMLQLI